MLPIILVSGGITFLIVCIVLFISASCLHLLLLGSAYGAMSLAFEVYCRARRGTSLRSSAFAHAIGRRFMRTQFSKTSLAVLAALPADRQCVFACDTHGPGCHALTFGFAAHGGVELPAAIAQRTVVMAHWLYQIVPLARDLFAACGVVPSPLADVSAALDAGHHVALCPSGIRGFLFSHMVADPADSEEDVRFRDAESSTTAAAQRTVDVCKRHPTPRIFAIAHERQLLVVPVLSPDEEAAYDFHWQLPGRARVHALALGPRRPLMLHVGAPLDARNYVSATALTDAYYASLRALGSAAGYRVIVHNRYTE